jgi:hypothetical protein
MGGEFKNRLSQMKEAWTEGKNAAPGVPDGVYTMQLQNCELDESGNGNMMVKREHLILDGEHAGEVVRDQIVFEGNAFGARFLSQFIEQMGYESPDNPEDIEDVVTAIAKDARKYTAQVKKAKDSDFRNVRIKALLEEDEAPATPAAKAAPAKAPPAKVAAAPKAAPKKAEPAAEEEDPFPAGSSVTFSDEGNELTGKVNEKNADGNYIVETEDGNLYELDADSITAAEEVTDEQATGEAAPEEDTAELIAFCQAHSIECADDEDAASLTEKINQFEYEKSELTKEEVELLEKIGATIKAPAPKPAPKAAPKPAAKGTAKTAPKPAPKPAPKAAAKPAPKKAPAKKK